MVFVSVKGLRRSPIYFLLMIVFCLLRLLFKNAWRLLILLLCVYERALGLRVNYEKTEVSFSKGVPSYLRREIADSLEVKEVEKYSKYLGIPTIIGHSKKEFFQVLVERVWKKVHG